MGCRLTAEHVRTELPWYQIVKLPEPETVIAETSTAGPPDKVPHV